MSQKGHTILIVGAAFETGPVIAHPAVEFGAALPGLIDRDGRMPTVAMPAGTSAVGYPPVTRPL